MNTHQNTKRTLRFTFPVYVSFILFSLFSLNSCGLINSSEEDPTYLETLVQLQVQQTMVAQEQDNGAQLTLTAQNSTQQAQQAQVATQQAQIQVAPPTLDPAIAVQETIQALQTTQQAEIVPTDIPQIIEPSPTIDLESRMKSANILLYEDMVSESQHKSLCEGYT